MDPSPLRLLILVAHPDDAEFHAGGLATIYRRLGHVVKFVSLTNGDAGHHRRAGPELAERRRAEAEAAGRVIGAEVEVWPHRDGRLEPSLELRWQVIAELRRFRPDLVLTHRTIDYHPDHRAVAHLVRDASYLVTVPALVSDVPILPRDPVVAYLPDRFTRPVRLAPDVVLDVGDEVDSIVDMLACHASQVYEWLPYNRGALDQVPAVEPDRRAWLRDWYLGLLRPQADRYRDALVAAYGADRGRAIEYAEIYEISEYAAPLADARLFPGAAVTSRDQR